MDIILGGPFLRMHIIRKCTLKVPLTLSCNNITKDIINKNNNEASIMEILIIGYMDFLNEGQEANP